MNQPTLRTVHLELVPLADEHLECEIELDSDPEVLRYLFPGARTRAEVTAAHERRLADARDGFGFWVGFAAGEFVGWWLLRGPSGRGRSHPTDGAELGYRLLRRRWRQGLASEGSSELLRHAFDDLGLDRVFAQTMAVNAGSRAVMTSVGMSYVRTFDGQFDPPLPGTEHGEVEYAITRTKWAALDAGSGRGNTRIHHRSSRNDDAITGAPAER